MDFRGEGEIDDNQDVVGFDLPELPFDEQPVRNLHYWSLNYGQCKNHWC